MRSAIIWELFDFLNGKPLLKGTEDDYVQWLVDEHDVSVTQAWEIIEDYQENLDELLNS